MNLRNIDQLVRINISEASNGEKSANGTNVSWIVSYALCIEAEVVEILYVSVDQRMFRHLSQFERRDGSAIYRNSCGRFTEVARYIAWLLLRIGLPLDLVAREFGAQEHVILRWHKKFSGIIEQAQLDAEVIR